MAQDKQAWFSKIEREVLGQALSGGLDLNVGEDTQQELQGALLTIIKQLAAEAKRPRTRCDKCGRGGVPGGRDISALIKGLDEYTRLLKFVQGEPDHLVGMPVDDQSVLRWLTDQELDELLGKVRERKALAAAQEPE